MMKKWLLLAVLWLPLASHAASEVNWPMDKFDGDLSNLPSLQNGFKLYVNMCIGCHSLKFQRYGRTADDLGIPRDIAFDNLIFTGQKIGDLMTTSMDPVQSKNWFGATPPDLTMVTRVRNPDWVYNYLRTFYVDENRPLGTNNKVFPNVGMPNVFVSMQGLQRNVCMDGETGEACSQLTVDANSGELTPEAFDQAMYDLTNFLYYVSEPSRMQRESLGLYVLLFLIILGSLTYLLNREYWKDIEH